jgi:hypothetical protein
MWDGSSVRPAPSFRKEITRALSRPCGASRKHRKLVVLDRVVQQGSRQPRALDLEGVRQRLVLAQDPGAERWPLPAMVAIGDADQLDGAPHLERVGRDAHALEISPAGMIGSRLGVPMPVADLPAAAARLDSRPFDQVEVVVGVAAQRRAGLSGARAGHEVGRGQRRESLPVHQSKPRDIERENGPYRAKSPRNRSPGLALAAAPGGAETLGLTIVRGGCVEQIIGLEIPKRREPCSSSWLRRGESPTTSSRQRGIS